MRPRTILLPLLFLLTLAAPAGARILPIPPPPPPHPHPHPHPGPPQPVAALVERVQLELEIHDGVATARLHETVRNPSGRSMEARFVLPIPRGAAVHSASLELDGEWIEAELLDAQDARQAYEDIVRRRIDPALIEYLDEGLLRTRVFPVPPGGVREIRLSLQLLLEREGGQHVLRFPLRALGAHGPAPQLVVHGQVHSTEALATPWSPTHRLAATLSAGGYRADFSLEGPAADTDLLLLLPLREDRVGLSAWSTRPIGEDGAFLLRLVGGSPNPDAETLPKDLLFVLDVSGSMEGEKLRQAKEALRQCLHRLRPEDRFALVSYEAVVRPLTDGLVPATTDRVDAALRAVGALVADGGTNIGAALTHALALAERDGERPAYLLFLTDGLPTVGEQDIVALRATARRHRPKGLRLFSFGVGDDVNTRLLDGLAREGGGRPRYVLPGEDLERALSALARELSEPLWTDLTLRLEGAGAREMLPDPLGDLFRGQTLSILGRYREGGPVTAVLRGRREGRIQEQRFPLTLADAPTANAWLPRLWASRRIAQLQAALRDGGDREGLLASIVELGTRYGLLTEYTSLLMRENDELAMRDLRAGQPKMAARQGMAAFRPLLEAPAEGEAAVRRAAREARAERALRLDEDALAPAPATGDLSPQPVSVGRRMMMPGDDGAWVDPVGAGGTPRLVLRAYGEGWMELARRRADLRSLLALGERLRIVLGGEILAIAPEGEEDIPAELRGWLFDSPL